MPFGADAPQFIECLDWTSFECVVVLPRVPFPCCLSGGRFVQCWGWRQHPSGWLLRRSVNGLCRACAHACIFVTRGSNTMLGHSVYAFCRPIMRAAVHSRVLLLPTGHHLLGATDAWLCADNSSTWPQRDFLVPVIYPGTGSVTTWVMGRMAHARHVQCYQEQGRSVRSTCHPESPSRANTIFTEQ